jgi:hypothetical protein
MRTALTTTTMTAVVFVCRIFLAVNGCVVHMHRSRAIRVLMNPDA